MAVKTVLLLGDDRLFQVSEPVEKETLEDAVTIIEDLKDTLAAFKEKHGYGRAVAAPPDRCV